MDGTRIASEREKLGLTQAELAEKVNVSQKSISKYERGERRPTYETLTKMSELFGVSTDYLLGKSNEAKNDERFFFFFFDNLLKEAFKIRLNTAIQKSTLSKNEICDKASIDMEDLEKYLNAELEPSLEDLVSLSQALSVTTDYLLGQVSEKTQNLIQAFSRLNEDYQDIVIGETKKALRDQKRDEAVAADSSLKEAK